MVVCSLEKIRNIEYCIFKKKSLNSFGYQVIFFLIRTYEYNFVNLRILMPKLETKTANKSLKRPINKKNIHQPK